jgi:hypothetical protein
MKKTKKPTHQANQDAHPCQLCAENISLSDMREHVGKHIILASHQKHDPALPSNVQVGAEPCGWCGVDSDQCRTTMYWKQDKRYKGGK